MGKVPLDQRGLRSELFDGSLIWRANHSPTWPGPGCRMQRALKVRANAAAWSVQPQRSKGNHTRGKPQSPKLRYPVFRVPNRATGPGLGLVSCFFPVNPTGGESGCPFCVVWMGGPTPNHQTTIPSLEVADKIYDNCSSFWEGLEPSSTFRTKREGPALIFPCPLCTFLRSS